MTTMPALPLRMATISAVAMLTAAACTSANQSSEPAAGGGCTIGMSQINQTAAFFTQMNEGAKEAADSLGCQLTITNANDDPTKQLNDIQTLLAQGVSALIVVPIDETATLAPVVEARKRGVKIISVDGNLPNNDTFVGVDNAKAGQTAGEWVVKNGIVAGSPALQGVRYGVVDSQNSEIQIQRADSFGAVVTKSGAVLAQSVDGKNVQETAATAAQNLLTANPDLKFVYTTGEPATAGAVSAIKPGSQTVVVGWDLNGQIISGIDSGVVRAVVQQNPKGEGEQAVREAKSMIGGAKAQGFIDVPVTIVTRENVDQYRSIFS